MKNLFFIPSLESSRRSFLVILGAAAFAFLVPSGQAQTVAQHSGMINPTNASEGWAFTTGSFTALAPDALTGGNDGEDYWRIKVPNDASGYYSHGLVSPNLTDPSGWTATMRAKVNTSDGKYLNCHFGVADGVNFWVLNLGGGSTVSSDSAGVFYEDNNYFGPNLHKLSSIETLLYRTYQMVYDPGGDGGNGSVKYYVDGTLIATLIRAGVVGDSGLGISFGDNNVYPLDPGSDAQYALVRFELGQHPIPAPSVILSISPLPNATGVDRTAAIDIALLDGLAPVQTNMIQLFYNTLAVSPTISKPPGTNVTMIHYDPPGLLPATNTIKLIFNDTASTKVTNNWSFQALVNATVVQHVGTNDPSTEGFFLHQSGTPPAVLTGGNDGEGFWRIHQEPLNNNSGGSYYRYDLASVFLTNASGWTFTMRAKVNRATGSFPSGGYGAVVDNFYAGTAYGKGWLLAVNGGPNSVPPVPPEDTGLFYGEAAGVLHQFSEIDPTPCYRTYQIIYDPGNSTATYYVDGIVATTLTPSDVGFTSPPRVEWGDGTGDAGLVDVQYNLIRFEVGQHPFRPSLLYSRSGNQLTLSWLGCASLLQTNGSLSNPGGWADLPGGTSSPTVVTIGPGPLFFRLRQ